MKHWQKCFPTRKAIMILEIVQRCRIEILELSCMVEKLYLVWDQKYVTFYQWNLKILCFLHYLKRKFVNGAQRIVHGVYMKCTYKTLDFCKLSTRTSLFCNMWHDIHKGICWSSGRYKTRHPLAEIIYPQYCFHRYIC